MSMVLILVGPFFVPYAVDLTEAGASRGELTADEQATVGRAIELMSFREVRWPPGTMDYTPFSKHGPETALPVLLQMVRSADPATRVNAMEALGERVRPESLDVLAGALRDPVPEVRQAAGRSLANFDPAAVHNRVMPMLCENWPESKDALEPVLSTLKMSLEPTMLDVLGSPDETPQRKAAAAFALGCMRSRPSMAPLAESAWSPDPELAMESAQALAAMAVPEALAYLIPLIQHPVEDVRWTALDGVAASGTPQAVAVLGAVAADTLEENRSLQERAVELLAQSPLDAAIPALIEAMRKNLYVRRRAGETLRDRTGMTFGDIPSEWAEWYAGPPPAEPGLPPMPPLEEAVVPRRFEIVLPDEAGSGQP